MRGFKAFAFAATASVLLAGSLQAQTSGKVIWGGNYGLGTVSTYRSYRGEQGIFRSPYYASLDPTNSGTFGRADIFCVDFAHYANTSSNGYSAFFTNLGTDGLTKTRSNNLVKYMQAAWLADQMVNPLGYAYDVATGGRSTDQLGKMQAALWKVLSPMSNSQLKLSLRLSDGTTWTDPVNYTVGDWWATAALNAVNAGQVNANEWVVVTDQASFTNGVYNGNGSQEYITQVTPEPATMLLLGTGLVVMLMAAGALRRPVA